jgi:hypothetical protein
MIVDGKPSNLKAQKTKDLNIRDANLDGLNITFFVLHFIIEGISRRITTTYFLETTLRWYPRNYLHN